VDQLIRHSGDIDIYVISGEAGRLDAAEAARWRPTSAKANYVKSVALVALATLVCEMMRSLVSPTNLVVIYLIGVIVAAIYLGRGPAILASILSVLAFDYFLVPPRLTLAVSDTEYFLTFIGLLAVGLVISHLAARVRGQVEAAQRRQAETATLYAISRDLAAARGLDDIMQAIVSDVSQTFGREVIILLPDRDQEQILKPSLQTPHFVLNDHEVAVAAWAFQHGEPAGRGTDTLSMAAARYLPLKTAAEIVGVMGVQPTSPDDYLTPDQRRLLEACASLAALAIERAQLAESARAAQLLEATKKLQTALLNSVSHDLRTPLVSITGVLSTLADDDATIDEATRRNLIETATEEAERLNRLVGNLLDMTRIEADALNATREPCDVQDLIGTALERLAGRLDDRQVAVQVPADLPLVPMDFVLMVQVLINIVDNAIKYSPAGSPIDIQARLAGPDVEV
jgi:two-component system sensor histidine kinase KdpD